MQEAIDKSNKAQRILVVGATGKQGGAVARHLLNNGFEVRALTRNQESPAARRLAAAGAVITVGDLEDVESLVKAMAGVGGVFSIQNYWAKGVGYEGEIRQGKNLANAAKRADVRHFVQSTMADGQAFPQQLKHFRSKATVDQHIKTLQLPYTFLGTVTFMDNVVDPDFGGSWTFPFISGVMSPQVPYHMLAVDDIGGVAAAVFANPAKYIGKKINMTSDRLTVAEMKQLYREVTGRSAKRFVLPAWLCRWLNREFVEQLQWQSAGNWTFGPEEAKEIYPNLTSFRAFLRMHQVVDL